MLNEGEVKRNCTECGVPVVEVLFFPKPDSAWPSHGGPAVCPRCYPKAQREYEKQVKLQEKMKEEASWQKCRACGGSGRIKVYKCQTCSGKGKRRTSSGLERLRALPPVKCGKL